MTPTLLRTCFILFVVVPNVFGQLRADNDYKESLSNDHNSQKMVVSLYPSRLLNVRYTGLELGFELKHNNWLSTEIRGTQLTSQRLKDLNHRWNPKITGNIVHIEERFNVRGKAIDGPYFAIGIAQLWSSYQEEYWFNHTVKVDESLSSKVHYLDTISIQKRYTDVFIKFGYQGIMNRLVIGFDVGIGGRYKDVRHSNLLIEDARLQEPKGINVNYINDQRAYKWVLFVPVSFRLGFLL